MSLQASGPGKTAARVDQDFLVFDPLKSSNDGRNILASHPFPLGDGAALLPHNASCKHDYATKSSQSVTPPLDLRPDGTTRYKLAVVCRKCRVHADIRLDYTQSTNPCPNSDCPLHHFQRVEGHDIHTEGRIGFVWQCSSASCRAVLTIAYRLGRLSSDHVKYLTNTELLKRRYEAILQLDPDREGIRQATPMEALSRLRRYIHDSLDPDRPKRTFPANNKRFMEAFGVYGQDCKELLDGLGFEYAVSFEDGIAGEEAYSPGMQEYCWTLPNPPLIANRLDADGSSHRELLEDVEVELLAWMYQIAQQSGAVNLAAAEGWPSANRDLERTLAAQGYQRYVSLRRPNISSEQERYFASLGALSDFADSLISFAYDRQAICDPELQPYYFECLREIAKSRGSEDLQMKSTMLESQGSVSRRDLNEAYRFFNLPHGGGTGVDDDRILNVFQAQQPDLGTIQQERSREMLYKIAVSRNSDVLMAASRQTIETYDQALTWLGNGATKDTPDDMITTIFALRTDGNSANEEIGRKAVSVIARARQSNMLNTWLTTGRTDGYTMNVDEALRYFGIEQSVNDVDATMWPTIFDNAKQDRPGDNTEKAIAAVQQALRGNAAPPPHSPETWPVGLTSHGNTCYLNSLLQYYFSIKPLRDIVLDYDRYKLDTSTHTEKLERVGQRKISLLEIKGGQAFAGELKHLFERMIKDPGPAVKPEQDLVCRAFLDPKDSDLWKATGKGEENAVAESPVEERKTNGLQGPEDANQAVDAIATTEEPTEMRHESDASSTTLQASVNGDDSDTKMKGGDLPPTPPASPGQKATDVKPEPTHAPPLPPRRFSTTTSAALLKAQENAKLQQDVTEVHDSIMFRLRAGMMPKGKDESEEQLDDLRELFSIGMTETVLKDGVSMKPKEIRDSSIQLNVPTEDTDIYSALDAVFDLQSVEENKSAEQYRSIQSLPPLLQISMPRIDFNAAKGGAFKAESTMRLEDELYLDRYCDLGDPELIDRRRSTWGWRKRLSELTQQRSALKDTAIKDVDGPTAIMQTAQYLDDIQHVNDDLEELGVEPIEVDEELAPTLVTDSEKQAKELKAIESNIKDLQTNISSQFADLKKIKYRLHAVFIHRGSAGSGHYWTYIHDFQNKIWRKYNDETVEEFTKLEDMFEARGWTPGTPTYAVYVRDDSHIEEFVQAVFREPEPTTNGWSTTDVQMLDGQTKEQPNFVDPKLVEEGGRATWDNAREVAGSIDW